MYISLVSRELNNDLKYILQLAFNFHMLFFLRHAPLVTCPHRFISIKFAQKFHYSLFHKELNWCCSIGCSSVFPVHLCDIQCRNPVFCVPSRLECLQRLLLELQLSVPAHLASTFVLVFCNAFQNAKLMFSTRHPPRLGLFITGLVHGSQIYFFKKFFTFFEP